MSSGTDETARARSRRRAEWMARAQEGDRDAYRALLEDVRPLILGWLRRWLRDADAPADVSQGTLVQLPRARHTYAPARPFEPWLFALARHSAADHGRLRKRRMREILVEDVPEIPIDGDQERPALAE